MAILLEDKGRDYRRYRPSANEKIQLGDAGFQWVLSSNVSAITRINEDLVIRFHNGSVYSYKGQYNLYEPMLRSNSKGKFVWRELRRKNKKYQKLGSFPLKSDIPIDDEELFENIRRDGIRVEEPQILDQRDVVQPRVIDPKKKKPTVSKIKTLATIAILDSLPGIDILPGIEILNINPTNTSR